MPAIDILKSWYINFMDNRIGKNLLDVDRFISFSLYSVCVLFCFYFPVVFNLYQFLCITIDIIHFCIVFFALLFLLSHSLSYSFTELCCCCYLLKEIKKEKLFLFCVLFLYLLPKALLRMIFFFLDLNIFQRGLRIMSFVSLIFWWSLLTESILF